MQADEAIMVGDDWENDIVPARAAGLNTFWVCPDGCGCDATAQPMVDGCGTLADFASRVQDEDWLNTLRPQAVTPDMVMPRLIGNLAAVAGVVREAPAHVWHMHPDEAEWSPVEVLCHLVDSERDVQRPRLERILAEDNPFLSRPKTSLGRRLSSKWRRSRHSMTGYTSCSFARRLASVYRSKRGQPVVAPLV